MQPEPPPVWIDQGFEAAVHAADRAVRDQNKRVREQEHEQRRKLRKPTADEFPFHAPVDVLNAALTAVSALAETPSPAELSSYKADPRKVFKWVRDQVHAYGNRCREEGRQAERSDATPKLAPEVALKALTVMGQLESLLNDTR